MILFLSAGFALNNLNRLYVGLTCREELRSDDGVSKLIPDISPRRGLSAPLLVDFNQLCCVHACSIKSKNYRI